MVFFQTTKYLEKTTRRSTKRKVEILSHSENNRKQEIGRMPAGHELY